MTLEDAANVAVLVQTVAIVGGLGFVLVQLRQGRTARNLETISFIFEGIHKRDSYETRRRLAELTGKDISALTSDERIEATMTTDFFQRMGFLADREFIDKTLVLSMYSGLIVEMWTSLEAFISHVREDRQLDNYANDFQRLAAEATYYRSRLYPVPPKLRGASGPSTSATL